MIKSPTIRLLVGLLVTLVVIAGFSWYSLYQISELRRLQSNTIDFNRHDSYLLLQVQNGVNTLGLKLQEIDQNAVGTPISRYQAIFNRVHDDVSEAFAADAQYAYSTRMPEKQQRLLSATSQFWTIADRMFSEAQAGRLREARAIAAGPLSDQQILLSRTLSSMLQRNNRAEAEADRQVERIYSAAHRDTYLFMIGTFAAILITSLYLIYSNRVLFNKMESLSKQRRVLAARLIDVQEEVFRSISRELHDEFGQILTAVGAMLSRAEKKGVPPDSPLRTELAEVKDIIQTTLEKLRSFSQMLHPAILDDYGLAKGLEWYAGVFERQTGIRTSAIVKGKVERITGQTAAHCFRIVQEALSNAAKHSGSQNAEIELDFNRPWLTVRVRDFGKGMTSSRKQAPGLGLIAMRERAEIVSGELTVSSNPATGTTVTLRLPLDEAASSSHQGAEEQEEVLIQNHE